MGGKAVTKAIPRSRWNEEIWFVMGIWCWQTIFWLTNQHVMSDVANTTQAAFISQDAFPDTDFRIDQGAKVNYFSIFRNDAALNPQVLSFLSFRKSWWATHSALKRQSSIMLTTCYQRSLKMAKKLITMFKIIPAWIHKVSRWSWLETTGPKMTDAWWCWGLDSGNLPAWTRVVSLLRTPCPPLLCSFSWTRQNRRMFLYGRQFEANIYKCSGQEVVY